MSEKEILTEILRRGLLEIRLLSSARNRCSCERINALANILHNLPKGLGDVESIEMDLLKKELNKYEKDFEPLGESLSLLLESSE